MCCNKKTDRIKLLDKKIEEENCNSKTKNTMQNTNNSATSMYTKNTQTNNQSEQQTNSNNNQTLSGQLNFNA